MAKVKDYKRYFKNAFNRLNVGRSVIKEFFSDHLQRLIKNNKNGKYDAWIQALTLLLTEVYDGLSKQISDMGIREGIVVTQLIIIKRIKLLIHDAHPYVLTKTNVGTDVYKQFYISGLTAITRLNIDKIEQYLDAFVTASVNNPNVVPKAIINELKKLKIDFTKTKKSLSEAKSGVVVNFTKLDADLLKIELQCTRHLLRLADEFLEEEEFYDTFFDNRILKSHGKHKKHEGKILDGTINPLSDVVIASKLRKESSIVVENKGIATISFYFSKSENDLPSISFDISAGKKREFFVKKFFSEGDNYFKAANNDSDKTASYQATIYK